MNVQKLPTIVFLVALFAVCVNTSLTAGDDWTSPETVQIPAGSFVMGSDPNEREYAYRLDEAAYGHSRTRKWKWYDGEVRKTVNTPTYQITKTLVTNYQYSDFVKATGHPPPEVNSKTWAGYGLIHPYSRTRRHAWAGGIPPKGRGGHPVVLVSINDASAYASWVSQKTGQTWRLPNELEWEKAARGVSGYVFPWGNTYDASRLNSHDLGPFDTLPVGSYPDGASPFGMHDAAGQVFEWTSTQAGKGRYIAKGGSWDDKGCGVCRPAARHSRPASLKHILIGFRLVHVIPQ